MKVALHNLGCKVNAYETEAMHQMLEENGYEIVEFAPGADVYIINTCTVTNIADRKSRQMLHKAKKMNPSSLVIAAGCYAQADSENLKKDEAIDIIIGNNRKKDLLKILSGFQKEEGISSNVIDINHTHEYENITVSRMTEHTRAYIKVQDGCNQFCSYCIIPFARGRVRSRLPQDVLEEVKRLAAAGCHELVLTGIHLSSYGVDLEEENLLSLIKKLHQVEGIQRIRLGSLEPGIITEEFASELAALPKLCPHFHLSLQSGCESTLKRMNRKYTAKEYKEKCDILRKYFQNPALTTDVITGFPGETEEDFEESRSFVESISFYETHIFKYSRRKGTRAAVMPDQVDDSLKAKRSAVMIAMGEKKKQAYMQSFIGQEVKVLLEEEIRNEKGEIFWTGYTPEYIRILLPGDEWKANMTVSVIPVEITADDHLLAKKVEFSDRIY